MNKKIHIVRDSMFVPSLEQTLKELGIALGRFANKSEPPFPKFSAFDPIDVHMRGLYIDRINETIDVDHEVIETKKL